MGDPTKVYTTGLIHTASYPVIRALNMGPRKKKDRYVQIPSQK